MNSFFYQSLGFLAFFVSLICATLFTLPAYMFELDVESCSKFLLWCFFCFSVIIISKFEFNFSLRDSGVPLSSTFNTKPVSRLITTTTQSSGGGFRHESWILCQILQNSNSIYSVSQDLKRKHFCFLSTESNLIFLKIMWDFTIYGALFSSNFERRQCYSCLHNNSRLTSVFRTFWFWIYRNFAESSLGTIEQIDIFAWRIIQPTKIFYNFDLDWGALFRHLISLNNTALTNKFGNWLVASNL